MNHYNYAYLNGFMHDPETGKKYLNVNRVCVRVVISKSVFSPFLLSFTYIYRKKNHKAHLLHFSGFSWFNVSI